MLRHETHASDRDTIRLYDVAPYRLANMPAMVAEMKGPIHVRRKAITIRSCSIR